MKNLTVGRRQSERIWSIAPKAFAVGGCCVILGFGWARPAQASIYLVTTNNPSGPGSLSNALAQAQSDSGAEINFQSNLGVITVAGMLPQIQNNLVINGNSNVISGGGLNRIFFINAPAGTVLINSLTLEHGSVRGGSGGIGTGGGGGGAGLGGAIFLNSGNLTVTNLVFSTNSATGGSGGVGWQFTDTPAGGGGGGGGLDFNGGNGFGGSIDGGMTFQGPGGGGGALTSAGGSGTADTIGGGNGGGLSGGPGGSNQLVSGNAGNGGSPITADGGGGGGGLNITAGNGGNGGKGSDFGGGGGAGSSNSGSSGFSGNGGFGGGGGGGAYSFNGVANPGGNGGFGGGGGGNGCISNITMGPIGLSGLGGFGAENGYLEQFNTPCGGAGLGAGGAIFAREGTTLSVEDCSFAGDTVAPGASMSSGASGIGAALFLGGNLMYSVSSGTNVLAETIGGGNDPNAEGGLTKGGAGTLVLTATNSFVGNTTVNAGTLRVVNNVLGSPVITIASNAVFEYNYTDELTEAPTTYNGAGTLRLSGNGEVVFGPGAINVDFSSGALIDVQGGKLFGSSGFAGIWTANQSSLNIAAGAEFDAVEAGPSGTMQIDALTGAGTFLGGFSGNKNALTTVTIGVAGGGGTFSGTLQDEVSSHLGLIKTGAGSEIFSGTNTYTGGTSVNAGTLDINGNNGPGYVIALGGTLGGTGTIGGPVSIGSAGTLSPGAPAGTLTINNNLSLAGNTFVALDAGANSGVAGLASVTFGGTLTITNLSGPLVFGSHYTLFSAATYFGNFSNIMGNPGAGLAYSFNPTNGVLTVLPTLPSVPTNLSYQVSSGVIKLAWPSNYIGWILQMQTNTISGGISTNWMDVLGSALVHSTNIPVGNGNCAFFRMRFP